MEEDDYVGLPILVNFQNKWMNIVDLFNHTFYSL